MRIIQIGLDKTTLSFLRERGILIEESGSISNVEELQDWLVGGRCDAVAVNINFGAFGIYAARHLRNKRVEIPVVGISQGSEGRPWSEERAIFLESGGDDLLRGPANPRELAASLFAVSRRYNGAAMDIYEAHHGTVHLKVNQTTRSVLINGREPDLSHQEREIVLLLAAHPGRVLTREAMLEHLYAHRPNDVPEMKIIDVFMTKTRKKIESIHPDARNLIETVWGQGYRLTATPTPISSEAAVA